MKWLRFLSRLAFISNIVFLIAMIIRFRDFLDDPATVSMIGIIGYFLVFILNPLVNISYLVVLISRKKLFPYVQPWLVFSNLFFLLLQVLYILFINDILHS